MSEHPGVRGRRAGVLGSPIAHSLSPVLHRAAYLALGLADWHYSRHDVGVGELAPFVGGLDQDWAGVSVTMPGKEEALALADEATPRCRLSGAANTLVRTEAGWRADNTDIDGITTALAEAGYGQVDTGWVIGSGATARSALIALAGMGASTVHLQVRSAPRPTTVKLATELGLDLVVVGFDEAAGKAMAAVDVAISTVPAGTAPVPPSGEGTGAGGLVVLDVAYHPRQSRWATAWARRGAGRVDGASMLLHQASAQVEIMTGQPAPVGPMRAALLAALQQDGRNPW